MSKMISVKTSDLTGAALDWAVGVSMGNTMRQHKNLDIPAWFDGDNKLIYLPASAFSPSTDWAHGGPLVDQFKPHFTQHITEVTCHTKLAIATADTYLIAICRAVVASKLGDVVEVPAELMGAV